MRAVRSLIFWLHLTLGCVAGLVILAMSVTGIMLAFERQISGWADAPAAMEGQSDSSRQASLDSMLSVLKHDGQGVPTELVLHNNGKSPIEARFGRDRTLYLNPSTGEIIGQPSKGTREFFGTVERVHRSLGLGMRSAVGRGITGAANLAFLFMLISGLYLWLPKLFNITSLKHRLLFRGGLRGRAREWNWHNVIGIWTVTPLFFIVLTGVIMSYPWASNLLYKVTGTQPPAFGFRGEGGPRGSGQNRTGANDDPLAAAAEFRSLDDLALVAKQQVAGWKSITIPVPTDQDQTVAVSIDKSVGGQPEQASQLVINRANGNVVSVKRFSDNNAGRKLRAWARFTHTGEEFGFVGQAIAALASLGAVFLVWTGLSMAIRRALSRKRRLPELSESARSNEEVPTTS